jgi:hypothetical protein
MSSPREKADISIALRQSESKRLTFYLLEAKLMAAVIAAVKGTTLP